MGPSTALTAGVIGLGEIGSGVAEGLLRAGIELVVCDVRPEALAAYRDRATVAEGPAALGEKADVVLVAVVTDAQALAVLDGGEGALVRARPGTVVVVLSTLAPSTLARIAELARARQVEVVDCGVSGGPAAAGRGELVAMVGGDEEVVARIGPVLEAFSSTVVPMGPLGAGLRAKLARNLVQYGSWLAAYEAQRLAEAAGIELAKLAAVIRASDRMIGGASTLMFRTTAAPFGPADDAGLVGAMQSAAALAHKDLRAALELGDTLGVPLPLAAMTDARADALFGLAPDPDPAGAGGEAVGPS